MTEEAGMNKKLLYVIGVVILWIGLVLASLGMGQYAAQRQQSQPRAVVLEWV